jgi:MFS family permease
MMQAGADEAGGVNDPRAKWMAVIAFINQNIAIAGIFGSFSVLLTTVETRLNVGRELSTLAMPALTLVSALCGPLVGTLATRYSLRMVMLIGSILGVLGFVLLATTASFPLYIVAFALCFGPTLSAGTVLPAALVTRWFVVNRGKALGFVCAPIVIGFIPLVTTWALQHYGIATTYLLLAGLGSISVIANLFIIDRPPGAAATPAAMASAQAGSVTIGELLRMPRFWARTFGFAISAGMTVMLTAHMVPIGKSWGFSDGQSASLLAIQSVAGIVGTIAMGWVADRLGGVRTLMLLLVNDAILFVLFAFHPGFAATAAIAFLFGSQSAANVPIYGMALSQGFGRENFARAFGLAYLLTLPFSVLAVPYGALIFARTGSYSGAMLGGAAMFALVALFIFVTRRDKPAFQPVFE